MSCNGCRVLRKGCSESCILRACLQWIPSPAAQGNATLFLARFFGRSDLMSLITAVSDHQRPALFQSLLFEACGRTVNPVNGAVGLLSSGNWHVCQSAVETVLAGGALRPLPGIIPAVLAPNCDESSEAFRRQNLYSLANQPFLWRDISEIQVEASSDLRLSMSSTAAKLASRICSTSRGWRGRSCAAAGKRRRETMSEESEMTSGGSSSNINQGGSVERKLLNLFV